MNRSDISLSVVRVPDAALLCLPVPSTARSGPQPFLPFPTPLPIESHDRSLLGSEGLLAGARTHVLHA